MLTFDILEVDSFEICDKKTQRICLKSCFPLGEAVDTAKKNPRLEIRRSVF